MTQSEPHSLGMGCGTPRLCSLPTTSLAAALMQLTLRWAFQRLGDVRVVHHVCLDAITAALDLRTSVHVSGQGELC